MSAIEAAVEQVKGWMRANGASLLVENLAPGATADQLGDAERRFGFALPQDLGALWRLHFGQHDEQNGFIEHRDLLDATRALDELDTVLATLESLRESPPVATGATQAELASERWVPFAGRDSDLLVVHGETGRVFVFEKDWPPLRPIAPSLAEWLTGWAAKVVAGDYEVEEGFGDCYLSKRDREAEARAAATTRKRDEAERHRRETPLLEQLDAALRKGDGERCREVFEDLAKTPQLHEGVDRLFVGTTDVKLIATALQWALRDVELDARRWRQVREGGVALGNEAIVGVADERTGARPEPVGKNPWWRFW